MAQQSHVLRTNPAVSDTIGFEPHGLVRPNFLEFMHPEDEAAVADELKRLAETGGRSASKRAAATRTQAGVGSHGRREPLATGSILWDAM